MESYHNINRKERKEGAEIAKNYSVGDTYMRPLQAFAFKK